ncbi:MAG TPA: NADP-specific glutamate dehydrogenase [Acidimicrobiales bacterium]|nr:NADP-specific glutamate dehydrogenase [Acidimicrobiales bacterium]
MGLDMLSSASSTSRSGGSAQVKAHLEAVTAKVEAKNPGETEFHQAVREVAASLEPVLCTHPRYMEEKVLERLVEPDRVIAFGVNWVDDHGEIHVNRGYRVQMSSSIGPYKGGLRFHPSVNAGILKFLAFEQTLKDSLTTLPIGGAKGGSDFDPKGRSESEIRRFCQSFMTELYPFIGEFTDVPAGDIGVGEREIGYLFGQYKRIAKRFAGVLTGKGLSWGGSQIRQEATGYGAVYFAREMLGTRGEDLQGKTCLVSGSGNVAQFTVEKLIQMGARPVTLSDSDGFVFDPDGIDAEKLEWVKALKNDHRGRIREYAERYRHSTYHPTVHGGANPLWAIPADCAFPSATQNEISDADAAALVENRIRAVVEGANMPTVPEGVERFLAAGVLFGPSKAANAGGVAVSALEMAQDIQLLPWARDEVENRLAAIMRQIHDTVRRTAEEYGSPGDYRLGANIAGFIKVADAMLDESPV